MCRNSDRINGIFLAILMVVLSGCAAGARGPIQDRQLRAAIEADQQFTLKRIPSEAPAHRVASFRIAGKGLQAIEQNRLEEAEDLLEQALSLDRRNPFCYYYLAELRFQEQDLNQALILLDQARVMFQGHPYWLGEVYAKKGKYFEKLNFPEKARDAYAKALQYNPWNTASKKGLQ